MSHRRSVTIDRIAHARALVEKWRYFAYELEQLVNHVEEKESTKDELDKYLCSYDVDAPMARKHDARKGFTQWGRQ